jgi:protein SCO1/2
MKYSNPFKTPEVRRRSAAALALAAWLVAAAAPAAVAQTAQEQAIIQSLDFEQKLDATVPLDATFTDEAGREVQLRQYFGKKPVVLTLVYYECPMLCTEVLNGLLQTMQEMQFTAGNEFDVVTVSIDPGETPALAAEKRDEYLRRYGRQVGPDSWHFLTGREEEIKRLADSVGYKYVYDSVTDQYAHPSGIVVLTPAGKVSHYFYGVQYAAKDVRLGLVEASANKIGSPVDKILLYCYHYDPLSGKYNVAVMNMIRVFGVGTVILMALGILYLLRREKATKTGEPGLSVHG